MSCNIKINKNGNYIVKADNGQPSILFCHLKATLGNEQLALEKWAVTRTPEFNAVHPFETSYIDINGEHSMLYVEPKNDFLYYGKKDTASSAKAKDTINKDDLVDAKLEIQKQSEIVKNTILKNIQQFKNAESSGSRTNRYGDLTRAMTMTLQKESDSVQAIFNFAGYSNYYLKEAKEKLNKLKSTNDTNARLESLNELSQLLIIFNNLKSFRDLTGTYEKSLFQNQVESFFDEYSLKMDVNIQAMLSKNTNLDKKVVTISKIIKKQLENLNKLTDKEKKFITDSFDALVEKRENLTSTLDDILKERDKLSGQLKNDYYNTLTDWLWPHYNDTQNIHSKFTIDKETFKNMLQQAQQDAGIGEYTLASLSTINDPIAQAIRLAAEEQQYQAHALTVEVQSDLGKALKTEKGDNIEDSEYDKYLKDVIRKVKILDENGNIAYKTITTKALVTQYHTETLEKDRNAEYEKQIEYFNKIEDDKIAKLEQLTKTEGLTDAKKEKFLLAFEQAKEDKDWNVRKNVNKAMNAWYETKYDVVKYKSDLIDRKKKELSEDNFKIWYESNIYKRILTPEELEIHKKTKKSVRVIHPERLNDTEVTNSSFYKAGRTGDNGKIIDYEVYEVSYGGEFTTPKAEYIDPSYAYLANDILFRELSKVYNKQNDLLPNKHKLKHGIIPQIEKSAPFYDVNKSAEENGKAIWKNLKPDIFVEDNAVEIEQNGIMMKVSQANQNVDGTIIKTVPVKFVSMLEEGKQLNTNLIENFSKFAAVTNRYNEMSKFDASARALKNIINGNPELGISAREIILTDSSGNKTVTKLKNTTDKLLDYAVKEKGVRLNALITDFIDDIWYGDTEEKESINILGKEVSLNKVTNFTSKWVSVQRLAGNLDSAISNLVIGRLAIFNESLAGKFYTLSQYYEASKIINKELYDGTVIKDYMQSNINDKSLYAQLMIRHDAIQGEFSNEYGIKVSKKTALEMGNDFLFFSQNGMEYTIQKRSMLCVSKGFKVQLPNDLVYDREANEGLGALRQTTSEEMKASNDAKAVIEEKYKKLIDKQKATLDEQNALKPITKTEIQSVSSKISKINKDLENIAERKEDELNKINNNYFTGLDAYMRDADGTLIVKEFLQAYFTPQVETKLRRRIQELNKRQQGIYSQFDKSQAQRHWLGKLALMFRKYLYSAYEHRFGDNKFNAALGEETYGYQRQFINKFLSDFKTYGNWAFKKLMDGSASPAEQYAINKTLIEYATWASFMVLFWLLRSLQDDDDEKNWALSKTAYIVKRTEDSLSEFTLPFGIGVMVRTFKNPISSITLVEQIYEVFAVIFNDPLNLGGVYERDSGLNEKGDSKFLGKLFKVLPILRQYSKFMTPEDQLKFYTQKKTNI